MNKLHSIVYLLEERGIKVSNSMRFETGTLFICLNSKYEKDKAAVIIANYFKDISIRPNQCESMLVLEVSSNTNVIKTEPKPKVNRKKDFDGNYTTVTYINQEGKQVTVKKYL